MDAESNKEKAQRHIDHLINEVLGEITKRPLTEAWVLRLMGRTASSYMLSTAAMAMTEGAGIAMMTNTIRIAEELEAAFETKAKDLERLSRETDRELTEKLQRMGVKRAD